MSPPDLIATLEDAPRDVGAWIVILWTWLTPKLGSLDSREKKLVGIRKDVLAQRARKPDLAQMLEHLRGSADLPGDAAATLARLERWVSRNGRPETTLVGPFDGVDGNAYYVTPWQPWLVEALWRSDPRGGDTPPVADYAPAMAAMAPTLTVVPVDVDGIVVTDVQRATQAKPSSDAIRQACADLSMIANGGAANPETSADFVVHFATLGPNTLKEFTVDTERSVFAYTDPPEPVVATIEAQLADAVEAAAAAGAAILIVPELAVPIVSLPKLQDLLREQDAAPMLTVAGLRHDDVVAAEREPATVDGKACSRWVNEAVALGADGTELFRHRKLTAFAFPTGDDQLQEDTRLGRKLPILRTAVGNIAVAICLDSFGTSQDRLERSYASLVVVPSLSKSVSPHRSALTDAVRRLWGTAFVCNRHPDEQGQGAWRGDKVRSFWTAAMLNDWRPAGETTDEAPTLVFDLAREVAGCQPFSSRVGSDADTDNPDP